MIGSVRNSGYIALKEEGDHCPPIKRPYCAVNSVEPDDVIDRT